MSYFFIYEQKLRSTPNPPKQAMPIVLGAEKLFPPLISQLHLNFWWWGKLQISPGPISPKRVWFTEAGQLAFYFTGHQEPSSIMQVGPAPDLAAWFLLLDQWMETFVVIARARAIWTVSDLAGALSFMTPAFLPPQLLSLSPNNWERVAQALATVVAEGPLAEQ